jgi:signal transduction histidine kinase
MPAITALPPRRGLSLALVRSATAAAVVVAGLLSLAMVMLILNQPGGGIGLAIAAVTMTLPVAYVWQAPNIAAFSLALAAAVNEPFLAHLARCGAALPATFFVAFALGYALGRRRGLLPLAATATAIVLLCVFDPRLGSGVIALMVPVDVVFFGAGLYVRRRAAMVATLRDSTAKLREQRDQTAQLAVAADREELTSQLNRTLAERLDLLSQAADSEGDPRERFATIERLGRQTLDEVRELLGSLRDSPTRPEPALTDLADVCSRATTADVRLTVEGTLRTLPASVELSVCRIVEQLLRILPDEPAARVRLHVDIADTGIDIVIAGTPVAGVDIDVEQIQTLANARAALHGGSVAVTDRPGRRGARVWLPLVTAHG